MYTEYEYLSWPTGPESEFKLFRKLGCGSPIFDWKGDVRNEGEQARQKVIHDSYC